MNHLARWLEDEASFGSRHTFRGHGSLRECMGVSKNRGTPKWMVKIMENPIKIDDLGVPLFLETPVCCGRFQQFQGFFETLEDVNWNRRP